MSTDPRLRRLEQLTALILQRATDPQGQPPLDFNSAIPALEAVLASQPLGAGYDPDQFLYLSVPREVLDRPLRREDFRTLIYKELTRNSYKTIEDLLEASEADIRYIRNFGVTAVAEIQQVLGGTYSYEFREVLGGRKLHLSAPPLTLVPPPNDRWVEIGLGCHLARYVLYSRLYRVPIRALETTWISRDICLALKQILPDLAREQDVVTVTDLLRLGRQGLKSLIERGIITSPAGSPSTLVCLDALLAKAGLRLD